MTRWPSSRDFDKALRRLERRLEQEGPRAVEGARRDLHAVLQGLDSIDTDARNLAVDRWIDMLDFLGRISAAGLDPNGSLGEFGPKITERVMAAIDRDIEEGLGSLDLPRLFGELVPRWAKDGAGHLDALESFFLRLGEETVFRGTLERLLKEELARRAIPFPAADPLTLDPARLRLIHERHAIERLLGEWWAADGRHEFAITVAEEKLKRTRDAVDLAHALLRAGQFDEALALIEAKLLDPRTARRSALEALRERAQAAEGLVPDREMRRRLERAFLDQPTPERLALLRRAVDAAHWPRYARDLAVHLQRHAQVPDLVFELWLELDDVIEADGLVVTQPIDPERLATGARAIAQREPARAAGWLLMAAHRRAGRGAPADRRTLIHELQELKRLALASGQGLALDRALVPLAAQLSADPELVAAVRALVAR